GERPDAAGGDELVEPLADGPALAEAEPADPCREPLERDARAREPEPAFEPGGADDLQHGVLARPEVSRIAGQRDPSVRPDAAREDRAPVLGDEAGNRRGLGQAGLHRACAEA